MKPAAEFSPGKLHCKSCELERFKERRKAAGHTWKTNQPDVKRARKREESKRRGQRKQDRRYGPFITLQQRAQCRANAEKRIEDERKAQQLAQIAEKPWLDPKLSSAKKYRLRYKLDNEFAIRERLRAHFRRVRRGVKIGDILRGALLRNGSSKIEAFVGYTVADLHTHL
jgi:hypothetical protein